MRQGIDEEHGMRTAGSSPFYEQTLEGTAMKSSFHRDLVLPFAVILGLLFFSASGSSGGPQAQGKGYPAATFYVA
jgi:hypothetical protein